MNLKKSLRSYGINFAVILGIFLVMLLFLEMGGNTNFYRDVLITVFIAIILAVSLNLTVGFLGQLALGHAGFMCIGAYVSALLTKTLEMPAGFELPAAIILGGVCAAFIGVLIGIPALRLKGDYLAIITLGFGEIIRNVVLNIPATGGAKGYHGIPKYSNVYMIFWIMIVTVFVVHTLIRSRHGRAIVSIREDEIASEASGVDTTYYKLFAFSLAAFFAGIAGVLYAHQMQMLVPKTFSYNYSIEMVIMVVLGGMGSITGSILAAVFLKILPLILLDFDKYRMLIYSVLLIAIMIFKPSGLLGKYEFSMKRLLQWVALRLGRGSAKKEV